jgi:hypothetical protein
MKTFSQFCEQVLDKDYHRRQFNFHMGEVNRLKSEKKDTPLNIEWDYHNKEMQRHQKALEEGAKKPSKVKYTGAAKPIESNSRPNSSQDKSVDDLVNEGRKLEQSLVPVINHKNKIVGHVRSGAWKKASDLLGQSAQFHHHPEYGWSWIPAVKKHGSMFKVKFEDTAPPKKTKKQDKNADKVSIKGSVSMISPSTPMSNDISGNINYGDNVNQG